jgi:hypothetical protein
LPFVEPTSPLPAELPSSLGEPIAEPLGDIGVFDEVLGVAGGVAAGAINILLLGALLPGDARLKPTMGASIQDLLDEGWQYHHWFPQQFDDEFDELGIDGHRYTTLLPLELHIELHQLAGDNKGWNELWEDWLDEAFENGYTAGDAVEYLYELLQPYLRELGKAGITGQGGLGAIVPYPGKADLLSDD